MIGLDKNEIKVFKKLNYNAQSVADIVRKTKMPRMTVYTNLLRLHKKKLVTGVNSESGKRVEWVRGKDSVIKEELEDVTELILGKTTDLNGGDLSGIKLLCGKKEIADTLMYLTTRKDGAKMYSIQNSRNWLRWIEVMGKKWVNEHNRAVVRHKLVCFTVHSKYAPEKIKQDKEVLDAYKGRLGNSHAIPEAYLKKDLSFYIFEDTIFLVNFAKVEATLFTDADMASFLIKMFAFMFEKADEEEFFLKYNR